ncbi:hypothetical protein [Micromonospora sp. NPDC005305]|uniref:hypothetical protein n=1 Tax=Micromonospora sp. NPDC005305 TaxID=3156875 RepID=UPI0033B6DC43
MQTSRARLRRPLLLAAGAGITAAALAAGTVPSAFAATVFSDTFSDSRITILNDPNRSTRICVKYQGVPKGSEPKEIGEAPTG